MAKSPLSSAMLAAVALLLGACGSDETTSRAPTRIDDVLANPGMGAADFHFGWWCNLPPVTYSPQVCAGRTLGHWPENYPPSAQAYFRWMWRDLEPAEGQINTELIDATIQSANYAGETLGFRVMSIDESDASGSGLPAWLVSRLSQVGGGRWVPGNQGHSIYWPDVTHPAFKAAHASFVSRLGQRYNDHPGVDHVDIGSVGCWGEWNTACVIGVESLIDIYNPASQTARNTIAKAFQDLIDDYVRAFPETPVVMLGVGGENNEMTGVMAHAAAQGAGWRVDCWGDWDMGGTRWSHQTTIYPAMDKYVTAAYPGFADVWKHAPVQLEICYTMQGWADPHRYSADAPDGKAYKSFQWAKDKHASVLNFKRGKIPSQYVSAMNDLLRVNGYRFVIDSFESEGSIAAGGTLHFTSRWSNLGVAPMYIRRALTYRLRSTSHTVTFESSADVRTWLPGSWTVKDDFTLPRNTPPGSYEVEVAILDRAATNPTWIPLAPIRLGIAGRRDDGWYPVSQAKVR